MKKLSILICEGNTPEEGKIFQEAGIPTHTESLKESLSYYNKDLSIDVLNPCLKLNLNQIIPKLKTIYEDYWKTTNEINTSIKLPLTIKVDNNNNLKIQKFENILNETDLIYDFIIQKFNKDFIYYQIIFNGTPDIFLETMSDENYVFDTQNKVWHLK